MSIPFRDVSAGLTGSQLEGLLTYDALTGAFCHVRGRGGVGAGQPAGFKRKRDGYVQIKIGQRGILAHRLAWLWMTGSWPDEEIDHINGERDDNRFCNLRLSSRSQNCINTPLKATNTSGHCGVYWNAKKHLWFAKIRRDGRATYLGSFKSKDAAIAKRHAAEIEIYGEYASKRR